MNPPKDDLRDIARHFQIDAEFLSAAPCSSGHINDTFVGTYRHGAGEVRFIHQWINHHVFKQPERVMENIERVTSHQRRQLVDAGCVDPERRALTIVPAIDGQPYHRTLEGHYWRTFRFIEDAHTCEAVQSAAQAAEVARAFGAFQQQLVSLPGSRLHETIPAFHDTPSRFAALVRAIDSDPQNRAGDVRREIDFALQRESITGTLLALHAAGHIPERITHNDTKLNNVMLTAAGEGICVIDLDTVMPGLALYDFGDMVRTATSSTLEDERELSKVQMQMPMFRALVDGYLSAARDFLTPAERDHLAFSGKLITFEIGLRFLTDHLLGDTYFKIHRPGQNLDRARTQFALVESIEQQEEAMAAYVAKRWCGSPG
ncbi:MAG: aminoglycoside phosphotransferase family protein [Chthoniobacteraceae bacterium]